MEDAVVDFDREVDRDEVLLEPRANGKERREAEVADDEADDADERRGEGREVCGALEGDEGASVNTGVSNWCELAHGVVEDALMESRGAGIVSKRWSRSDKEVEAWLNML